MSIDWQTDLETGVPALDAQHKGLFDCINDFSRKCDEGSGTEELINLLEKLNDYTKKHFSYEENLQRYNNYPGLTRQEEQHKLFIDELAELKKKLEMEGPSRELAITARGKLIRWLIQHIRHMDKGFSNYLQNRKS